MDSEDDDAHIPNPKDQAQSAGLRYVSGEHVGIARRKSGKGFIYLSPDGAKITDPKALGRIRSLVIPPAWTDVWICTHPNGHLQATGRDVKGRKQYKYHSRFRELREGTKFEHMMAFANALPAIRATVNEHMTRRGLPREKVLATVVRLLETTLIRVGNDGYAKQNKSYGLTTLKTRHAAVDGSDIRFRFTGKSGKHWSLTVRDRRIARIIKACQELPGQELLQYIDDAGKQQDVTSGDVNAYLREISGREITAKDFRTWAGTVLAAVALQGFESFDSAAQAKMNLRAAIERVAVRLGNTPTVCRKCYIHPEILNGYLDRNLVLEIKSEVESELFTPEEVAVLTILKARIEKTTGNTDIEPCETARLAQTTKQRPVRAENRIGKLLARAYE